MPTASVLPGMSLLYDVPYGEADGEALLLDLVRPDPMPPAPAPALVWIHGGGWEFGDKRVDPSETIGSIFIQSGFVGLSINYRLSGQAIFPAQIHDAKAAIRWLRANAGDLGVDPDRIGVWGHSAGAHLAALLGTSGDIPDLEGECGSPEFSSRIQAVVAIASPSDFLAIPPDWPHEEPRCASTKLVGGRLEERLDLVRMANPITHIRAGAPPFLIIHGEDDEIVPIVQGSLLYDALVQSGTDATFVRLPKTNHMLESSELGIARREAWIDVAQRALEFFQRRLRA